MTRNNAVPTKKVSKVFSGVDPGRLIARMGSTFGGGSQRRLFGDIDLSCFDKAEVQVPATPAPKKKAVF